MTHVVVREHARLTTDGVSNSLDRASISRVAFDWLVERASAFSSGGAKLTHIESRSWLRLENFVGIVEAPDGTQIEILPKVISGEKDVPHFRTLLIKMIRAAYDLPVRIYEDASVQAASTPLVEWLARRFLDELHLLARRGLRSGYERHEEEARFVRGRIDIRRQSRKLPSQLDCISVVVDELTLQTRENALLKAALDRLWACTSLSFATRRQLAASREWLRDVLPSVRAEDDFRRWRNDRLMQHYRDIRPLTELILRELVPLATAGEYRAISLLFPMERLFEKYVTAKLREHLLTDVKLRPQVGDRALCEFRGKPRFWMQPDILVEHGGCKHVLDVKWKRAGDDETEGFGIAQSDMYQLFAYGHRYQQAVGDIYLVYPMSDRFTLPAGPFHFSDALRAYALPFDLFADRLILPQGAELDSLMRPDRRSERN